MENFDTIKFATQIWWYSFVNDIFTVNGCAVNDFKTVNEIFFRRFAPLTIFQIR